MSTLQRCCRMCGCSYAVLVSILDDVKLLEQISKLFNITILETDQLPTTICNPCSEIINYNWEFYVHVQKVQTVLKKQLKPSVKVKKSSRSKFGKEVNTPRPFKHRQNEELPILTNEQDVVITDLQYDDLPILTREPDAGNIHDHSTNNMQTRAFPFITDEQEDESESVFIEVVNEKFMTDTKMPSICGDTPELNISDVLLDETECENSLPNSNYLIDSEIDPLAEGDFQYQWKCTDCLNIFVMLDQLQDHCQQIHQQQLRYMCIDCTLITDNFDKFTDHVKTHRPWLKFCCKVCGHWFTTFGELVEHRLEHKNGWTICPSGSGQLPLNQHKLDTSKYKFKCPKCLKPFKNARGPAAHKRFGCITYAK